MTTLGGACDRRADLARPARGCPNTEDTLIIVREDDPQMVMQNEVLKIDDVRAKHLIP